MPAEEGEKQGERQKERQKQREGPQKIEKGWKGGREGGEAAQKKGRTREGGKKVCESEGREGQESREKTRGQTKETGESLPVRRGSRRRGGRGSRQGPTQLGTLRSADRTKDSQRRSRIKYREPPEARKPRKRWRLYPFKGEEALKPLHIHRQSAYLLGRERLVADIPIDHPSCSKQHAALQYRLVDYEKPDGTTGRRVKPYIIDLESANGTYVNNQRIEASRYVELMEKDVVKFGYSSREYVLLHDTSDTSGVQAGEDDEGLDE
uniref:SNIP1 n=1 Tax=Branchiostoma belcheri TaxID=7741 RepID=D5LG94_BRABE|nr:SNIP1 [Branchiostoma belcheri]